MNPTDHWNDVKAAGDVPPPSPEVLAHARQELEAAATRSRRRNPVRRRIVPVLATTCAVAAVGGGIAVYRTSSTQIPATVPSATAPIATGRTPSGEASQGSAASCAFAYSPEELKKRTFAFDGTVLSAVADPSPGVPQTYTVTFAVNEWFRPGAGIRQVVLRMDRGPGDSQLPSEFGPRYTIGYRLLITGDMVSPEWEPAKVPVVWGCGFSRIYDPATAATWRKAFGK